MPQNRTHGPVASGLAVRPCAVGNRRHRSPRCGPASPRQQPMAIGATGAPQGSARNALPTGAANSRTSRAQSHQFWRPRRGALSSFADLLDVLAGSLSKSFLQFLQQSLTSWPLYSNTNGLPISPSLSPRRDNRGQLIRCRFVVASPANPREGRGEHCQSQDGFCGRGA